MKRRNPPRSAFLITTLVLGLLGIPVGAAQTPAPEDQIPAAIKTLVDSARVSYSEGRYKDAETALTEASSQLSPDDNPARVVVLTAMGDVHYAQAQYDQAKHCYEFALAIEDLRLGTGDRFFVPNLIKMGQVEIALGQDEKAEQIFKRALDLGLFMSNAPTTALAANNLATLYRHQGRLKEAEEYYETALRIDEDVLDFRSPAVANDLNNLALLYVYMGEKKKAEDFLLEALSLRERQLGSDNPGLADTLADLAKLRASLGEFGTAESLYERLLPIEEKVYGKEHPLVADVLAEYGQVLYRKGSYARARILFARAIAINEKAYGTDSPPVANLAADMAQTLEKLGRQAEAKDYREKAARIRARASSE